MLRLMLLLGDVPPPPGGDEKSRPYLAIAVAAGLVLLVVAGLLARRLRKAP